MSELLNVSGRLYHIQSVSMRADPDFTVIIGKDTCDISMREHSFDLTVMQIMPYQPPIHHTYI